MKHKKERRELNKKKKVTQNVPKYMVAFYFLFPCFQSWVLLKKRKRKKGRTQTCIPK